MLTIQIICVGKLKEKFYIDAFQEYAKRLSKYCNLLITEINDEKIPDKLNIKIENDIKEKECNKILNYIKKESYVIALDLNGKQMSSESFSKEIDDISLNYTSHITFIIGGSLGLIDRILQQADKCISFSKMTFPHQLIRIFLLEQLFRAFKISRGETYHR